MILTCKLHSHDPKQRISLTEIFLSMTHNQQSYNMIKWNAPEPDHSPTDMLSKHQISSILLALALVGSCMAYSGHVFSHATTDPGLCALCIHPGKPDTAINPELTVLFVVPINFALIRIRTTPLFLPVILHNHQSRAPPIS